MKFPQVELMIVAVVISGCASTGGRPSALTMQPPPPEPVRVAIAPPPAPQGSIWNEDVPSLFADNIARKKGDIVTVLIAENFSATRAKSTSTNKTQSTTAAINDLTVPGIAPVLGASAGPNRQMSLDIGSKRSFAGDGTSTDTNTITATVSMQVLNVMPNGNLMLIGKKEVVVAGETQVVTLTGIARPSDINPDNTLSSNNLADAHVHIAGKGSLDDAQRRTLVGKALDWVNLF